VAINLPSNNLRGSLMSELGHLSELEYLALNHNFLIGTIPEEIKVLTDLSYLALHYNQLSGTLTSNISELKKIHVLGLSNNKLTGTIPSDWSQLDNLVTLGLDDNALDGQFSTLESLTNLRRIYINNNGFTQNISAFNWQKLQALEELDLSYNRLEGEISLPLFELPNLQVLSLGNNRLSGNLPLLNLSNYPMRYLAISGNQIGGSIHSSIGNLVNLVHLDLSINDFTGYWPNEINSLTNLKYLFLSQNEKFEKAGIPQFLEKLTKLKDLSLSSSKRVAAIPGEVFEKLSDLVLLDVGVNELTGGIPSKLARLTKLKYLILNRNKDLEGTVPAEVQLLPNLDILLVDQTSMIGNLTTLCDREHSAIIVGSNCPTSDNNSNLLATMDCHCCNICCTYDDEATCHDSTFFGKLDPIWESSFQRKQYEFEAQIFEDDDDSSSNNGGANDLGGSPYGGSDSLGIGI